MKPYEFYRSLHGRDMDLKKLSKRTRVSETQLSMMFSGARSGANSWKHVAPHLTDEELKILKRDKNGEQVRDCEEVPCETNSQL